MAIIHMSLVRIRPDKKLIFYHRLGLTLVALGCTVHWLWVALMERFLACNNGSLVNVLPWNHGTRKMLAID